MQTVSISCPACGIGQIIMEPHALLSGALFKCPHCDAALSLHHNSETRFKQSLQAYEQLKTQLQKA